MRHTFGKSHRLNLDTDRASVMRQIDELSGDLELLVAFGGIGRLKPRGGAVAHQPDLALCEQALHPRALLLADGRLNTMLVGGPQLDGFEAGSFEHADNRFHIEILQQVAFQDEIRDRCP